MCQMLHVNVATLRNVIRTIRIVAAIYKQLLLYCHLKIYILLIIKIDCCSKVGRREDLHADEESTESFAS